MTTGSIPPKTEAARDAFLVVMASSYWEALEAIEEFESQVQEVCSSCLSRHRLAIGRALGKRIPQSALKSLKYEEAGIVSIGAEARFGTEGRVYAFASWEQDEDERIETNIYASLWLSDARAGTAFGHAVHGLRSKKTDTDDHETWYAEAIPADDFPRLSERLETLLTGWERILARVGPLKDLRK
jgi:hypothetical protein